MLEQYYIDQCANINRFFSIGFSLYSFSDTSNYHASKETINNIDEIVKEKVVLVIARFVCCVAMESSVSHITVNAVGSKKKRYSVTTPL